MSARFSRGSSVLAALVLAAFVGGLILSIHQIAQSNQPSLAYSAAAAGAAPIDCPKVNEKPVAITDNSCDMQQPDTCKEKTTTNGSTLTTYYPFHYYVSMQPSGGKYVTVTRRTVDRSKPIKDPTTTVRAQVTFDVYSPTGKLLSTNDARNNLSLGVSSGSDQTKDVICKAAANGPSLVPSALSDAIYNRNMNVSDLNKLDQNTANGVQQAFIQNAQPSCYAGQYGMPCLSSPAYNPKSPLTQDILQQLSTVQPCGGADGPACPASVPLQLNGELSTSQAGISPDQLPPGVSPNSGYIRDIDENGNPIWCNSDNNCLDAKGSVVNPPPTSSDTETRIANLQAQCDAGNCDAKDYATLAALKKGQDAKSTYGTGGGTTFNSASCPGGNCGPSNPGPQTQAGGGLSNGFLGGLAKALLGGFVQGLHQMLNQPPQMACTSDPNAYNQALQQYQQQMQQYNQQLQQYNYQSQIASYQGYPPPPQPQPPSQPCYSAANNGGNPGPTGTPTAQISCAPQTADVGQSIAISFSCGNASGSAGSGFDTGNQLSGSASTTISNPPAGATAATYSLQCRNSSAIAQAQCSVQITRPSIILVANPKVVAVNASSTIGWVTTGMQSCVISSPDSQQFTAQNAANTSVNGVATTPPLASSANFVLNCTTIGGLTKAATTTVQVGAPGSAAQGAIAVTSSADGASISRGDTVNIAWSSSNPPSGSQIQLWLFDAGLQTEIALIQSDLSASSTYSWVTPAASSTCAGNSPYVCGSDLVPGRSYAIEADLFTGASTSPTYIDYGFTPQNFSVSQ